ncbi:LOW QUALITY PROTEIN: tudor domain-containing protein 1 [Numida meleagris]|uniref:LOW QUALITY PROTEIN: tudor domain-containing protein 1 n=1 Tax=Numida meleagris TaxID=8996 RepID=UPI000B3DFBB9|nr:LOW QUALITY PROTEIN: tudor domain-containing protein 1 [Numida meleagris]
MAAQPGRLTHQQRWRRRRAARRRDLRGAGPRGRAEPRGRAGGRGGAQVAGEGRAGSAEAMAVYRARASRGVVKTSLLLSYAEVTVASMAQALHVKDAGSSMESTATRRKLPLTAATDNGEMVSHTDSVEKPKKLQYSFENIFSIGYDKSLFSSLTSPPPMRTCHHCGLSGSLRCSQCKQIYYCSVDCQKRDWPVHSTVCEPVKQNLSNNSGGKLPARTETGLYIKDNLMSVDSFKTEEHIKKIMLSDLQTLGLKKTMEVQGTVTEFKSPSEFYIQMNSPKVLEQISKLSVKLQDCYANAVTQEQYIAVRGEICVARNSLDQTWRRALIKDVDVLQKKAQVFYIDCGKEGNIPLYWIKALHKDIELFPPCAIKCSFANYDPEQQGRNEGIATFSSQLMGKTCSVTVVDVLQEEMMSSFAVDVVLPDGLSEKNSKESKEEICEDKELLCCGNVTAECVSICIGDTFSVVVSHIQNPEDFFCQQIRSGRHLAELQVRLCKHCNELPSNPNFRPVSGEMCCAQFTEDDVWYRATVIAHTSENNVVVGYIDYGNFEVLQPTRLRPMIPKLMDLPAQAIRCTLAGIKPPLGAWTSEAISLMKQLVKDKALTVKVVGKESYRSVVELIDASVIPEINISRYLIGKGCAAEAPRMACQALEMGNVKQADEDTTNNKNCKWSKLSLKQAVDVIVCTLYSPGEFYCQIANSNELRALNSLNKSLFEYCQKTPPNVFKPEKGEPCCALFSDDGNWYRALVQNVTSGGTVKVLFVDYGNVEEVPLDKIRQISSSFLQLPFQGIKCWLSGIKPADSKWNPEATERFRMCTAGLKLQARITCFSRDGAGVELIDNSMGYPKVINEMLTSEKLAVKEDLPDKNNFPTKSDKKVETSPGHWESIELAVDQTVSVCVTEVISPDLFYAVPVHCKDREKLLSQLTELQDYCKSCKKRPFRPKLGEACCARFSVDGRWYRALVLEVSQSTVQVLYVDYGNSETLPLSNVLPITDSYLKLPFQMIACSLAGIKKVEWSPLVLNTLKEMLLNKYVTITVKGVNGNVKLVKVEKQSENGSLNVADKLVTEGLVKYCQAENSDVAHQGSRSETKCCCCTELKMQLKKHEQVLLFLLNQYENPEKYKKMKKLLESEA